MTSAFTTLNRDLQKLATSLLRATLAQAREASLHRKTPAWLSASYQGLSCPLQTRLGAKVSGRGVKRDRRP